MRPIHRPGSEETDLAPTSMPLPVQSRSTLFDLRSPNATGLRRGFIPVSLRVLILILLDILSIASAWELALLSCPKFQFLTKTEGNGMLPLIIAIFVSMGMIGGLYKVEKTCRYLEVVWAASLTTLLLFLVGILYQPATLPLFWFWGVSILLLWISRVGFAVITDVIRNRGSLRHPVFLIANPVEQERSIQLLHQQNYYRLVGVASSDSLDRANREATFKLLFQLGVIEVFISPSAIRNRLHLCWRLQNLGITVRILMDDSQLLARRSELEMVGEVPTSTLRSPILLGSDYWIKRSFDFLAAVLLILLLSPVYAAIAIAIKADSPGSIFFKQTRIGLHNQPFQVWKFRTMVQDASKMQAELEAQNKNKDGVLFKMKDDPRVTQVGKLLRQYSLDELPQLFNILLGEMSLVGPRPLPLRDVEKFKEQHFIRQEVLPGITGLWQVSGRSDIDNFEEAVRLDLNYISHWSLLLDLKILLQTVQVVLQKSGAY